MRLEPNYTSILIHVDAPPGGRARPAHGGHHFRLREINALGPPTALFLRAQTIDSDPMLDHAIDGHVDNGSARLTQLSRQLVYPAQQFRGNG